MEHPYPAPAPATLTGIDHEHPRLVAWAQELRAVHERLRDALQVVQGADPADLLLLCHGFCTALTAHHEGEDRDLFPAVTAAHPELADTLRQLQRDHSMIAHLLGELQRAVDRAAGPAELDRHVGGIAAIMESHFRYEERALTAVLDALRLDADPRAVLGPL